jgi:hypothetical protein
VAPLAHGKFGALLGTTTTGGTGGAGMVFQVKP